MNHLHRYDPQGREFRLSFLLTSGQTNSILVAREANHRLYLHGEDISWSGVEKLFQWTRPSSMFGFKREELMVAVSDRCSSCRAKGEFCLWTKVGSRAKCLNCKSATCSARFKTRAEVATLALSFTDSEDLQVASFARDVANLLGS